MKNIYTILAVAFSGFSVYLFEKLWGNKIDWEHYSSFEMTKLLTFKIELYQIVIFTLVLIILFTVRKKITKGNGLYNSKQKKLREFNSSDVESKDILMRWEVYFDNHNPFIANLTPFCKKHDSPPIRFVRGNCPVDNCPNHRINFNEDGMKNIIESDLIDRWQKLK